MQLKSNTETKTYGIATVRFSTLPQHLPEAKFKTIRGTSARTDGTSTANSRFNVMREYTGVVLVRNGRVIGVDSKTYRFGNNDYNIGVELEFTGDADELFGVTSLKIRFRLKKKHGTP